jgi:hypothetical protein
VSVARVVCWRVNELRLLRSSDANHYKKWGFQSVTPITTRNGFSSSDANHYKKWVLQSVEIVGSLRVGCCCWLLELWVRVVVAVVVVVVVVVFGSQLRPDVVF